MVTREPEWDDESRGRALALAEYEDAVCGECNLPLTVCRSEEQAFIVHQSTCYARRARDRVEAAERKAYPTDKHEDHWRGRQFVVLPHDPESEGGR